MSDSRPTDRQIHANRLNAQKSTGPRSAEGKAKSSRNATKLGLFAQDLLMPGEDPGQFERHKAEMLLSLNPSNAVQLAVAEQIVDADWKIRRLRRSERSLYEDRARIIAAQRKNSIADAKETLKDFRSELGRAKLDPESEWSKAHPDELEKNQTRLAKLEQAIVDAKQKAQEPPDVAEITLALFQGHVFSTPELDRLMKYQQQLMNAFNRGLNQLRQLKQSYRQHPEDVTELTFHMTQPEDEADDVTVEDENEKTNPIESQELAGQEDAEAPNLPPLPSGEGRGEGVREIESLSLSNTPSP